jgi:hypothetical protein
MVSNEGVSVECCFCGEAIKPSGYDPCQLSLSTHVLRTDREPEDSIQDFFCHADCLRERLATNARRLASLIDPQVFAP